MYYFDNAATSGIKPQSVIKAVENALRFYSANPGRGGYSASIKAAELIYDVRIKLSDFFGADGPENVVFTLNCTHSINCVLKGVLAKGDHALVSSMEHNAVMRPLKKMRVPFDVFKVSLNDDKETLMELRKKIKPNTRLIFCTAASNVTGKALPLAQIGEICREKGILFGVDAAQGAGVLPIDMKKMNIDYLCVAPHKGLYAPMGVGVLICRKDIPDTILEGGTGTNSLELTQPDTMPEKLESGTVNLPGIAGIGAGLDFVNSFGREKIYRHEMKLCEMLYKRLEKNPFIRLYTPLPKENFYVPVIPFNIEGIKSSEGADFLAKGGFALRGGYHCAPLVHRQLDTIDTGALRFSVSFFNNISQCEKLSLLLSEKNLKIFYKNLKKDVE